MRVRCVVLGVVWLFCAGCGPIGGAPPWRTVGTTYLPQYQPSARAPQVRPVSHTVLVPLATEHTALPAVAPSRPFSPSSKRTDGVPTPMIDFSSLNNR